jgi:hypothetical protein
MFSAYEAEQDAATGLVSVCGGWLRRGSRLFAWRRPEQIRQRHQEDDARENKNEHSLRARPTARVVHHDRP